MAEVVACPDCAVVQRLPERQAGGTIECRRCRTPLESTNGRSEAAALALAFSTLLLLFPVNLLPLLSVSMLGAARKSQLGSGALMMWQEGFVLMGTAVAAQVVVLPFFRFGLLFAVLASIRLGRQGAWTGPAFRWAERLDLWAMPDVFLIGFAIGYSRVEPFLPVRIEAGGWCLIGAAFLTMLTRATLDRRTIWRRIGTPETTDASADLGCIACDLPLPASADGGRCPRCRARIRRREPISVIRVSALLAAGYLLYPVANLFPMSVAVQLGSPKPHTIFNGVEQLVGAGLWPLAAIIFTTSIGIPLLKLFGLTWLCVSVRRGSRRALVGKTRLFRIIHSIGRWSNVDIYTIAVFLPLMQFGQLATVHAATGAPAFLAVVVLTMIAARLFDPRLMWDALGDRT